jgi:hypothetical protein
MITMHIALANARVTARSSPLPLHLPPTYSRNVHCSSRYIHVVMYVASQSIVCEWHQFQGLNVVIYSQFAKFSALDLDLT